MDDSVDKSLRLAPAWFDADAQTAIVELLRDAVARAPFFRPVMPRTGKPFSVQMTSLGPLGWVSDRQGYRYQTDHPETGHPWPPIPDMLLAVWSDLTGWPDPPECCLVNLYRGRARMGLHRDEDEEDLTPPVLSVSLGDTAIFRIGGLSRRDPTRSFRLASGDALVLQGASRNAYHGIDRVLEGSSTLLDGGGRINLTFRRVTASGSRPGPA